MLRHLALNAGRLVGKDDLMAAVWPGSVVTDDSLVQAIGDVRRALGEAGHRLVKTFPRRGYMLVAAAANPEFCALGGEPPRAGPRPMRRWRVAGGASLLVLAAVLLWQGLAYDGAAPAITDAGGSPSIAVLAFSGPPGDADGVRWRATWPPISCPNWRAASACASWPATRVFSLPMDGRRSPRSASACAAATSLPAP